MSATTISYRIPRPVAGKIARLRALLRLHVLVGGVAAIAILLCCAFWLALAIDWSFEPGINVRTAMWTVVGIAAIVVAFRTLLSPLCSRLSTESLALLLERHYPNLREGLITTVQAKNQQHDSRQNRLLLDATAQQTAEAIRDLSISSVLLWRPLAWRLLFAALLAISIAAFAQAAPETYDFWLGRMQLASEPWPRAVQLTVDGFDEVDGRRVEYVARDDEFDLVAYASILDEHEAPDVVEVRWRRRADGARGGGSMRRIGEALPGRDDAQEYRFKFKVSADMEVLIIGGDDRVDGLLLRAVERPDVIDVSLTCQFPEYTRLGERVVNGGNRVELPEGTTVAATIRANKHLSHVVVRDEDRDEPIEAKVMETDRATFTFETSELTTDRRLTFTLTDEHGVGNRQPYRLTISVRPDEAPDVSVGLRGIGLAVTPVATIPIEGTATDDYELADAWFESQVGQQQPRRRPLQAESQGLRQIRVAEAFDLTEIEPATGMPLLDLRPGDQLSLSLHCTDAYNLSDAEHVGTSQRFLLDVVTASELRAILEKRELGLRQRFEAIYEKMQGTRDLLDRIELNDVVAVQDSTGEVSQPRSGSRQRDLARLSGARLNARQLLSESLSVADGFDDIVAEMVNNRVDTLELKQRITDGIAGPLRGVAVELLPQFERSAAALYAELDRSNPDAEALLARSRADADEVVRQMKVILDRMLELESYNEIVAILRSIVEEQKRLRDVTKQKQRSDLRSLLED